jgi:hypothetical protein
VGDTDDPLAAVEAAERRLIERSELRRRRRERASRRRRVGEPLLRLLGLPLAGAILLVAVLELAGGDLRDWPAAAAIATLAGGLLWPALLVAWRARHDGPLAAGWAAGALGVQLLLTFGVALLLLGLGPR